MKQDITPIRTLIIEQDENVRALIEDVLDRQPAFELIDGVSSGAAGVNATHTQQPDLIFLNMRLPDMSGFDVVHRITPALHPQYVFLSDSTDDAIRAFEYFAFDYLLKPFTETRLQLTLIKLREQMYQRRSEQLHEKLNALFRYINTMQTPTTGVTSTNGHTNRIPVRMSGRIYFLHPDDIEYIEAAGYYIEVFAKGRKHLIRQSLAQLDEMLDSHRFIRIHRSVIINMTYLKEIIRDGANDFSVKMSNESIFRISRSYKPEVFAKIGL